MFYPRVALITTLLTAVTFIDCFRCDVSHPEKNCLTLWTAFQNSLLSQHNNLLRIDLMFNQPSQLTPTVVKVIFNYSIAGLDDCNSTCVDSNCSVVLGWTAKSLYIYFHASLINQLQFQAPFLIIKSLEGSELREEPDVDDYLWVGYDQTSLPELYLTLDVTFTPENNTLNGCPSNEDITNALGELNHWLRAFAKVALQGTEAVQNVNPDYKGYTLPQSGVEPYNWHESNKDPNENLGHILFFCINIPSTVIACVFGVFLYQLLLEVYDSEVERDQDFLFLVQFLTVTGIHFILLYLTDMCYYFYNLNNLNVFIVMKMIVMSIPFMIWFLLIALKHDTSRKVRIHVGVRTLAIVLLILSAFPTLLLFFAHPLNTFTLLVTHIALFYTETKTGMLAIKQLHKYECCKCEGVMLLIGKGLMLIVLVVVYAIAMSFYHILFLRSLINNLAFKIFIKYIPSVVIAVFGYRYIYLIQQRAFFNKKKEDKNEKQQPEPSNHHSNTLDEAKKKEKNHKTKETKTTETKVNSDNRKDKLTKDHY